MEKIILQHGEKCSKNFVLDRKISSLDDLMEVLNTSPSLFVRHRPYPSAFIRSWQLHSVKNWLDRGDFWTIKNKDSFKKINIQVGALFIVNSDFFLVNPYESNKDSRKINIKKGECIEIRFPYKWHFRTENNIYYHAEEEDIITHCKYIGSVKEDIRFKNNAKLEEILRLELFDKS